MDNKVIKKLVIPVIFIFVIATSNLT